MKIESALRDRLIMVGAAAPSVFGFGVALLFIHDLVLVGLIGAFMALVSAGITLSPPVTAARMRHLRRKYPKED